MSKHSPAPWKITDGTDGHPELKGIDDANGQTLIESHVEYEASGLENIYDARLIAAAPELLEACKAYLAARVSLRYQSDVEIIMAYYHAANLCDAAIVKAEGGE